MRPDYRNRAHGVRDGHRYPGATAEPGLSAQLRMDHRFAMRYRVDLIHLVQVFARILEEDHDGRADSVISVSAI